MVRDRIKKGPSDIAVIDLCAIQNGSFLAGRLSTDSKIFFLKFCTYLLLTKMHVSHDHLL